jgi:imidazolonepropionase-like amidohydrolase
MDILIAATRTNARLIGRESELGQIAPGMLADVLLLEANPLSDIRNTRRVYRVIRGGQLYQP